jgi:hypothetical protein
VSLFEWSLVLLITSKIPIPIYITALYSRCRVVEGITA